jgi:hypothetical protein
MTGETRSASLQYELDNREMGPINLSPANQIQRRTFAL